MFNYSVKKCGYPLYRENDICCMAETHKGHDTLQAMQEGFVDSFYDELLGCHISRNFGRKT